MIRHPACAKKCLDTDNGGECILRCTWLNECYDYTEEDYAEETRPIFEVRDTDEEARLDKLDRARKCK